MKRLTLSLVALALSSTVWSKCDENQIKYYQNTSFGLNLGERTSLFDSNVTVNIPLIIDGKQACYHQKNSLGIKTERVKEGVLVDFEFSPIEATFENVPEPAIYQYLNIEYSPDQKASKFQMMSFLCSGETPVGGDALADSLKKISENQEGVSSEVRVFIATGQAAENISVSQERKARAKVFDKFLEIYESKFPEAGSVEEDASNIFIPNILAGISNGYVSEVERKIYSTFFSRTNSSINGCSVKFRTAMQEYLLENVVKYRPFPGIEIRKKHFSSQYRMRWTL